MSNYTYFDAPIGAADERAEPKLWPGHWVDATGYATRYEIRKGVWHFHTGADLNMNHPHFNADRHAPFYAAGDGEVIFAGLLKVWGKVIVIKHFNALEYPIWTRYAHGDTILVKAGQPVKRGDLIGTVGNAENTQADHLHFDMARINLGDKPWDWPGTDLARVKANYIDPLLAIRKYRAPVKPPPVAPTGPVRNNDAKIERIERGDWPDWRWA